MASFTVNAMPKPGFGTKKYSTAGIDGIAGTAFAIQGESGYPGAADWLHSGAFDVRTFVGEFSERVGFGITTGETGTELTWLGVAFNTTACVVSGDELISEAADCLNLTATRSSMPRIWFVGPAIEPFIGKSGLLATVSFSKFI